MKKLYIVVADPYDHNLGPFNTERRTYTQDEAVRAASAMSRKHRSTFYVARLVQMTRVRDVEVVEVPEETLGDRIS